MASSFRIQRGEFTLPAELLEEEREYELSVYFAERLPFGCTTIKRVKVGDAVVVRWVRVRFLGWFDERGRGSSFGQSTTTPASSPFSLR